MKQERERPYKQVMRFFTPELYLRFNSKDRQEALRADADWEKALYEYDRHLDKFKEEMPAQVKELVGICLHDAEILTSKESIEDTEYFSFSSTPFFYPPPLQKVTGQLLVKLEDEIISLLYGLWGKIHVYHSLENWPFSKDREHWLYDEVDWEGRLDKPFIHRILLSSGNVLEISFFTISIHRVHLPATENKRQPIKSA